MKTISTKSILFFSLLFSILNIYSQDYLDKLINKNEFDKLVGLPLTMKYGQVDAVKIVFNYKNNNLYFINSGYYQYHFDFCTRYLGCNMELQAFNKLYYSDIKNKDYLFANINYFKNKKIYVMDLAASDYMDVEDIIFLFKKVNQNTYFGDQLYFLLNTTRLLHSEKLISSKINTITPSEIFNDQVFQSIGQYSSYGTLKLIGNPDTCSIKIKQDDIIIISEIPDYIPHVSGIIVKDFQTPLSHISLLAQNRHIPVMAYKNIFNDTGLLKLCNDTVYFAVTPDDYMIRKSNLEEPDNSKQVNIKLKKDISADTLIDIKYINQKSSKYIGHKAANFGTLYKLSKKNNFKTPEGAFAIPFYFYERHFKESGALNILDSLLSERCNSVNDSTIQAILEQIRHTIISFPVDKNLIKAIEIKMESSGYSKFRFRSSTNAEDAEGFSGAGLYTSKTGILYRNKKSINDAVVKVWASLWYYNAYMEREFYHINQKDVSMGILAHRSFPDEKVNGVVITKNLYRPDNFGFVVNAQIGEYSVVKPDSGIVCDQFICYPSEGLLVYEKKKVIDIITTSNLNQGLMVMSEEEIINLANQLEVIKQYFYNRVYIDKTYFELGLDIEFKLDTDNRFLYIKQVRLYND